MNESFFDILHFGSILISGKSRQPFLIHINPQWVIAGYKDVYSEIVFKIINEMRVVDVL